MGGTSQLGKLVKGVQQPGGDVRGPGVIGVLESS